MKTLDMSMQSSKATLDDLEQKELEYFVAAEQCFQRAIEFDSSDPEFLFHRGKLFFHQVCALLFKHGHTPMEPSLPCHRLLISRTAQRVQYEALTPSIHAHGLLNVKRSSKMRSVSR
jgi:hypothetical protein